MLSKDSLNVKKQSWLSARVIILIPAFLCLVLLHISPARAITAQTRAQCIGATSNTDILQAACDNHNAYGNETTHIRSFGFAMLNKHVLYALEHADTFYAMILLLDADSSQTMGQLLSSRIKDLNIAPATTFSTSFIEPMAMRVVVARHYQRMPPQEMEFGQSYFETTLQAIANAPSTQVSTRWDHRPDFSVFLNDLDALFPLRSHMHSNAILFSGAHRYIVQATCYGKILLITCPYHEVNPRTGKAVKLPLSPEPQASRITVLSLITTLLCLRVNTL